MVRTVVRLAKIMEIVLGEKNLTVNQFRMLTFIEDGAPPLAELTRRLVMKQPNVSVLIDGLVDRDLAVRERDPADGRRRQLRLTRAGLEALREAEAACDAALKYLVVRAGEPKRPVEGLAAWARVLDRVAVDSLRTILQESGDVS